MGLSTSVPGRVRPRLLIAAVIGLAILVAAPQASAGVRDRTAPRVSIVTPAGGATTQGTLEVTGTATDNVRVKRVSVRIDDGSYLPADGTTSWSTAFDSASYVDGVHTVKVKAVDTKGNVRRKSVDVVFDNGVVSDGSQQSTSPGPSTTTTPEGTQIDVDSAGPWTATQVAEMLQANGLDSTVGPRLSVRVQDAYASQLTSGYTKSGSTYTSFTATMYLKGVNSGFASQPDSTIAHEYGHAWSLYHLYMSQNGDWSSYLEARGLAGNAKLDTSYSWSRNEIIADDFRLLFGTDEAISQRPQHLNSEIPDPRNVPGLKTFLANVWASPA
jgi:hypothetical protein